MQNCVFRKHQAMFANSRELAYSWLYRLTHFLVKHVNINLHVFCTGITTHVCSGVNHGGIGMFPSIRESATSGGSRDKSFIQWQRCKLVSVTFHDLLWMFKGICGRSVKKIMKPMYTSKG